MRERVTRAAAVSAALQLLLGGLSAAEPVAFSAAEEARLREGDVLAREIEPSDDSSLAFRAAGMVDSPPFAVWPTLRDCEHYEEFLPATVESALLSREGNQAVCYTRVDMPFPLDDLVSEVEVVESERADGGFERRWSLRRGSYRRNVGSWTLLPRGEGGERTLAIYQVEIDPQTLLPDFLIRRAQRSTVHDLFRALRERVAGAAAAGP